MASRFYRGGKDGETDRIRTFVRMFPTGLILIESVVARARIVLGLPEMDDVLRWLQLLAAGGMSIYDDERGCYLFEDHVLREFRMTRSVAIMDPKFRKAVITLKDSRVEFYDRVEWADRFGLDLDEMDTFDSFLAANRCFREPGRISSGKLHTLSAECVECEAWEAMLRGEEVEDALPIVDFSDGDRDEAVRKIVGIFRKVPVEYRAMVCAQVMATLRLYPSGCDLDLATKLR